MCPAHISRAMLNSVWKSHHQNCKLSLLPFANWKVKQCPFSSGMMRCSWIYHWVLKAMCQRCQELWVFENSITLNSSHDHVMTTMSVRLHMCRKAILDVWISWNLTAFIFCCNASHNSKWNFTLLFSTTIYQTISLLLKYLVYPGHALLYSWCLNEVKKTLSKL